MHVLVTGGAGYIGSHTVRELIKAGHRVVILDNLSRGHREAVAVLQKTTPAGTLDFVPGDTGDHALVSGLLQERGIEAVLHFAAHSQVGESVERPELYYRNNVVHGLSLLDTVREGGVKYFIFSSTAAVYGEPVEVPVSEEHPVVPANPYGATKLAFEGALRWYGRAGGPRWMALRYFNAAGADPDGDLGEDHRPETHLIPLVLQAALGLRPAISIFGTDYPTPDGTCIRDYIHVTDLAVAHVLALHALVRGAAPAAYNLGNGSGYSVLEVVRAAEAVTGRSIPVRHTGRRAGDPAVLVAGARQAGQMLGWRPRFADLRTIIDTAWRWHQKHPAGFETV
ncbi:UDP-glucose 4-epimerase GalE [Desulfotomaculum copahuensis]|uniref:UDP-glucose 4-epimerase n=1 Tax=Desulfotomaculum copahuensis TaxID=1838280 RepID=A0A1B7LHL5_9FIRM|nr:UDP-glucose 4-epimerase GalE [Desulfotomaculum copahuensis]OAT85782.1 UDP-glucose 4-epimerase GalE [Desulfotomaculum copahuensis]